MMETTRWAARRDRAWTLAIVLLPALTLVLLRGVDANWDLRNYHLYDPHAWLTGRWSIDIAPAQLQSWHNPMLDLPLYLLAVSGWDARWTSLWLTLPFAFAFWMLLRLQAALSPTPPSRLSQALLAWIALTGAATYSTVGNSMNDGFVAAAILGALVLVLGQESADRRRWFLAGLVAGAAMGLKLTATSYCLALACMALVAGPGTTRAGRIFSLGLGGVLGFIATYGYWGWRLYSLYGNPFFPYYNNFFGSPLVEPYDWADSRFRAEGLAGVLSTPFQLLRTATTHSELYIRDPRLLLGAVGFISLFLLARKRIPALGGRMLMLCVFFLAALVLWSLQYGIYRYATTLELLGGLSLVLAISFMPRRRPAVLLVATLLVTAFTVRPDWGHVHHNEPMFGIQPAPVQQDSMVLIADGAPVAFMALGLPDDVPLVSVANNMMAPSECSGLQRRAHDAIQSHAGGFWVLAADATKMASSMQLLRDYYGMQPAGQCWDYPSSLMTARLCPVKRAAPIRACSDP